MRKRLGRALARSFDRRVLARWSRLAERAETTDVEVLRGLTRRAAALRERLDRVLGAADERIAAADAGFDVPVYSDWAYRPELWRRAVAPRGAARVADRTRFGSEATVFHDCPRREITVRQVRASDGGASAPFHVTIEVYRFAGSYLSLVLDLPHEGVAGLTRRHLVRLGIDIEAERPLEIFARLNLRHGPNTEQVVRELPMGEDDKTVEFDLAYTNLDDARAERMWIDLILGGPDMNCVRIGDVIVARRPRAEV